MHRIFFGTAIWVVILFVAEFALGTTVARTADRAVAQQLFTFHMLGGIFLATMVCVIHIMTMFHFIGSGKEIKEAVEVLGGDVEIIRKLRVFKMKTSGWATLAPVVTGAAVILGGGAHTHAMPGWIHWGLGLLAFFVNITAFPFEYRCLKANLELIAEVDARLKARAMPALPARES
jgi:hypothetical protein